MKSEVYFSKLSQGQSRSSCFEKLLENLHRHFQQIDKGSLVGIKMTVGDEQSTGYIKPELVRLLVEKVREMGGKPFVFDTNVIYSGHRQNAVDHLNLAYRKGFTPDTLGCPYIIADGIFGTDSLNLKVDFNHIKEIKIPSMIKVLENLIVLTHITGHMMSGFAGSIKNVAMGMATRAGKQIQHSSLKPVIDVDKCTACRSCMEICPAAAISEASGTAYVNTNRCVGCCECISACQLNAVNISWHEDAVIFIERMTEYAAGILVQIKNRIYINFATDITRECDCIAGDDHRIVEDAGILASDDILAVDRASYDLLKGDRDIFSRGGKITVHTHQFQYAQDIKLGKLDYQLKDLPE